MIKRSFARATVGLIVVVALGACATPALVRDEMSVTAATHPGHRTVLFFSDFQCPHCRRTHAMLDEIVRARHVGVRVVHRHVPLARHPDARAAAIASVCVERLAGDEPGERFAAALFEAPSLTREAIARMAADVGVGSDALAACEGAPATLARLAADVQAFEALGGDGVPLLYVDRARIDGAPSRDDLEAALR